jgi:hypothetical protein
MTTTPGKKMTMPMRWGHRWRAAAGERCAVGAWRHQRGEDGCRDQRTARAQLVGRDGGSKGPVRNRRAPRLPGMVQLAAGRRRRLAAGGAVSASAPDPSAPMVRPTIGASLATELASQLGESGALSTMTAPWPPRMSAALRADRPVSVVRRGPEQPGQFVQTSQRSLWANCAATVARPPRWPRARA